MLRFVPRNVPDPSAVAALRPYSGVAARLLSARGITTPEEADAFLHPSLDMLHDPLLLQDMDKALSLLARAKDEKWPVVVYGDYDVDGICAASLLTSALRRYGIEARPHTPLREEGYGLNVNAVRKLAEEYPLMVTVDLGITNHEEVKLAQKLGMKVIVTDHHGLPLEPSPGDAVINPLLGSYPYRRLCGTGVAFKLAQALLGIEACKDLLDLAALATVADIVPLTGENRVLVSLGLPVIAARSRPGIRALLAVSGEPNPVTAETLGFQLGPRLNAAGRLDDAGKGVTLMMTDDPAQAQALAQALDTLNTQRKTAESKLVREAEKAAADHDFLKEPALILTGDEWHVGVIGLAAGRLCQKYACPVCVLSRSEGLLHGSLRSVPGVHIHHCLQACDDLLLRYGGHEQAAGVTLTADNEEAFRQRLQAEIAKADPECFVPSQTYDSEITLEECTAALYDELSLLAPFGCENPAPLLLLKDICPEERRAVGAEGAHLKLTLRQDKAVMGGIAFSMGRLAASLPDRVDLVFSLGQNTFRRVTSLQAEVKAIRPVAEAQLAAFRSPDGPAEETALLNTFLALTAAPAGKNASGPEPIQGLPTEGFQAFQQSLTALPRGVLAIAHTNGTALRAMNCGLESVRGAPDDPRCFHTLLTAPAPELVQGHWAQVWLLDGELFPGEGEWWKAKLPEARIHALPVSQDLARLAARLDVGDERCRQLYKLIRRNAFRSLMETAQAAELTQPQTRTALHAFVQLKLATYTESPFTYTLLPPVPCSLGDSALLHALRALRPGKEE